MPSVNLVLLLLDIRLNTLTFKFFYNIRNTNFCIRIINITTTATAFIVSIINGKNTGSSPLTLTTCGLVLHFWFFIQIQLNGIAFKELAFVKSDKIVNPRKSGFLIN